MRSVLSVAPGVLLAGCAGVAIAQTAPLPPAVTSNLPRNAAPLHYRIDVRPDAAKLSFTGSESVTLQVFTPIDTLTLNAKELIIASAKLSPEGVDGVAMALTATVDAAKQQVRFTAPKLIQPGTYRLDVAYSGKINTQANGLFALDYPDARTGKTVRSLFTQFEAPDGRRFAPEFDEPSYKATFELSAVVGAGQMALSNTPIARTEAAGPGFKHVFFAPTPKMSSYLLFFATGDFDRISKKAADGVEAGVVAPAGTGEQGRYALDSLAQVLPYYDDYFGQKFPMSKLDNVAGPGQSQFFGAMENWGAIFTFERILLNDPAITSEAERQDIFGVEAHEMAHQWFGDLVTMGWWGDLWLNEGFASWMATKSTEHFHPDWGADIDRVAARESAMRQDSFKSTHPIVQDVRTVEQANQAFDAITYSKGESVLAMLEGFAGADVWQRGIQSYIREHAYQNTRTQDLWDAMEAAGATGLSTVARDFTDQPGIPLIQVGGVQCAAGQTTATLTQGQFSNDQRTEVTAHPRSWHVPVRASAGGGVAKVVTQGPTTNVTVPGCGPLLINAGQTGYYRTLYQPAQAQALEGAFTTLRPVDQFGVMNDQLALSSAAYQPMAVGLDFLNQVPATGDAKLVQSAVRHWSDLYDGLESDPAAQAAIATRVVRVYGPRLQQIGIAPKANEPAVDALLRGTLISTLGKFKDPTVLAEANRLFTAWQGNAEAIPGSLKETWLGVIARNADQATWDVLHAKARATTGSVERTSLYQLLGNARDEALARRALDLALTDEPGKTTSAGIITRVADEHPRLAIDFVLAHLAQVNELVDISGRSRFMERLAASSNDASLVPTLQAYAAANVAESDRKPVEQAIDRLQFESSKLPRVRTEVDAWLAAHPA